MQSCIAEYRSIYNVVHTPKIMSIIDDGMIHEDAETRSCLLNLLAAH